jgi:hypothetical protein
MHPGKKSKRLSARARRLYLPLLLDYAKPFAAAVLSHHAAADHKKQEEERWVGFKSTGPDVSLSITYALGHEKWLGPVFKSHRSSGMPPCASSSISALAGIPSAV